MIFVEGLLQGETRKVAWGMEEDVEVLAPILETPSYTIVIEVPIPIPEAMSSG